MEPRVGPPDADPPPEPPSSMDVWRSRTLLVMKVLFFVELGVMLVLVPWTHVWTENPFLTSTVPLRAITQSGFFRGAISGLGLINLWIAIADAVEYHE
jgi:hypothetical protein